VLVTGCYSGVGGFAGEDGTGTSTSGDSDAQGSESGSGGETGEGLECDAVQVGHMPLRRLTSEQYANAVRDLFGVEANVAAFGGDEKLGPFAANYAAPVSPTMVDQFRAVAEDAAAAASLELATLVPCDPATEPACLREWVSAVGRRAYRRPLTDEELARYETLLELGTDDAARVRLVVQAMLQSPSFLYQLEFGLPDPAGDVVALGPYELASRLSLFLWGSVPDDALLDAAAAGELDDPEGLRAQAERLLEDPQARGTVESFHVQWLHLDKLPALDKDPAVYPLFDEDVRAAMLAESRRFAGNVVLDGDAKLETLLTSSETWIDAPLFELYGLPTPAAHDPAEPVLLDPAQRAGLLTQASFLATHAHHNQTAPIHRGVVVLTEMLCMPPPPPPPDVNATPPDPEPGATTREIFEQHTAEPYCAGCHTLINGIGLGFEGYDGIGVFRTTENGQPIDQSGEVLGADVAGPFDGAVELAHKLAESQQVRDCVATQWFRFSLGRLESDADACTFEELRQSFSDSGYDVRALMIALVQTDAFRYRAQ
jgi:Protein of unknown function (DUF1592)/Protein of unknown function (DUF1588)/Protein of unknown function (DUF1585)/Protein of unknown function (DUF1595)/Protein of unknown function (DUF1587)